MVGLTKIRNKPVVYGKDNEDTGKSESGDFQAGWSSTKGSSLGNYISLNIGSSIDFFCYFSFISGNWFFNQYIAEQNRKLKFPYSK